jgi:hypothetical protein
LLAGWSSRSKCHSMYARIIRISAQARLRLLVSRNLQQLSWGFRGFVVLSLRVFTDGPPSGKWDVATHKRTRTHFFPKQSLWPTLNGFMTSLSSSWNSFGHGFAHLSGTISFGRWKLKAERLAAHRFIVTHV